MRFLDDSGIEMDTNSVERAMRSVALSRAMPYLRAAIASLVETCKLNSVKLQTYLTDLLTRHVNGWPQARINRLIPRQSAPTSV